MKARAGAGEEAASVTRESTLSSWVHPCLVVPFHLSSLGGGRCCLGVALPKWQGNGGQTGSLALAVCLFLECFVFPRRVV